MKKYVSEQIWTDKPHNFLWFSFNFTRYILTPKKLITRKGFLNVREDEILLYRIVDKSMRRSLGERIFGYGSIVLHSKDQDTPEKIIKAVKKPRQLNELLDVAIEQAREQNRVYGSDMYGALGGTHSHDDGSDENGNGIPDHLENF